MRSAEQWAEEKSGTYQRRIDLESFAKQVQADALRHCAALMSTPGSISQIWLKKHFESEADKLEA